MPPRNYLCRGRDARWFSQALSVHEVLALQRAVSSGTSPRRPERAAALAAAGPVEGLIDWRDIGTAYRERRPVPENRDRALIVGIGSAGTAVAQALCTLSGASALFDTRAAIMNTKLILI